MIQSVSLDLLFKLKEIINKINKDWTTRDFFENIIIPFTFENKNTFLDSLKLLKSSVIKFSSTSTSTKASLIINVLNNFTHTTASEALTLFISYFVEFFNLQNYNNINFEHNSNDRNNDSVNDDLNVVYIIHSWNNNFIELIENLKEYDLEFKKTVLQKNKNINNISIITKTNNKIFFYVDIFVLNFYSLSYKSIENQCNECCLVIKQINNTCILLPNINNNNNNNNNNSNNIYNNDKNNILTRRSWCIFEILCSYYLNIKINIKILFKNLNFLQNNNFNINENKHQDKNIINNIFNNIKNYLKFDFNTLFCFNNQINIDIIYEIFKLIHKNESFDLNIDYDEFFNNYNNNNYNSNNYNNYNNNNYNNYNNNNYNSNNYNNYNNNSNNNNHNNNNIYNYINNIENNNNNNNIYKIEKNINNIHKNNYNNQLINQENNISLNKKLIYIDIIKRIINTFFEEKFKNILTLKNYNIFFNSISKLSENEINEYLRYIKKLILKKNDFLNAKIIIDKVLHSCLYFYGFFIFFLNMIFIYFNQIVIIIIIKKNNTKKKY
jgi:hypothetical protein